MKRALIFVVLVGGLAVAAFVLARRPTPVSVVVPVRRPVVATLVASGRVEPRTRLSLAVEHVGTVVAVAADVGSRIPEGEVLAQLDDAELRMALDQARARLGEAEALVSRTRGSVARVAASDVRTAEVALEAARITEARERALLEVGGTQRVAVDEAARARAAAEEALARANERSRSVSGRGDEVRVGLATLESARTALRAAQADLDRATVRSPFDAVVLARHVEVGQVVQPGAALFELASSGPPEIVIHVDEVHLARLAAGLPALVSADAFPDRRLRATVVRVGPSVDPMRGTIEVRLRILDDAPDFLSDMTVSVEVETARLDSALTLPNEAVRGLGGAHPYVYVARGGRLVRVPIRIALRGDAEVAVASGLEAGATVVTGELGDLGEGDAVRGRRRR